MTSRRARSGNVAVLARYPVGFQEAVRNLTAWALWQLSRRGHDIGALVSGLAAALACHGTWNDPHRNAAGALLHHARKALDNRAHIQRALDEATLDENCKITRGFLRELSGLP